jgi:hypothetical protein
VRMSKVDGRPRRWERTLPPRLLWRAHRWTCTGLPPDRSSFVFPSVRFWPEECRRCWDGERHWDGGGSALPANLPLLLPILHLLPCSCQTGPHARSGELRSKSR